MTEVDASLRRLGTDYIDLYQIHRWDHAHADRGDDGGAARRREAGQGALHRCVVDVGVAVQQGAVHRPSCDGWTQFVSMQNHYNLLNREEEREMMPLCADHGRRRSSRGARSPAAGSPATGTRRPPARRPTSSARRCTTRRPAIATSSPTGRRDRRTSAACPGPRWRWPGCSPSRGSPRRSSAPPSPSTSTTRSPRSTSRLSADEIARLEEPYTPHPVVGFQ